MKYFIADLDMVDRCVVSLWLLIQGMKQEHEDGRLVTVTLPKALLTVSQYFITIHGL